MIGIYKITSPTGRVYIGQSIDIKIRFRRYKSLKCKEQVKLFRSLIKYGYESHFFEVLCECLESDLNNKERYYQDLFDATGKNGLNCILTKSSDRSGKFCEESRLKMSKSQKGRKQTKESIEKTRIANIGRKLSKEHKEILSRLKIGSKASEETKYKMSKSQTGRKHSEATKLKMSAWQYKIVLDTQTGIFYTTKELDILHNRAKGYHVKILSGHRNNYTNLIYV